MSAPLSITAANLLEPAEFTRVFGNVVEYAPSIASVLARRRPLRDVQQLLSELGDILDSLSDSDKVDVLRRYPDLAGAMAEQGRLSAESNREHESAGLHLLTPQQRHDIGTMNRAYRDKFGFPFIICARENKAASIFEGLTRRLVNTPQKEVLAGIEEVKKIARLRVLDLVVS